MKKKVCFITGTRADYGIMAPIMKRIEESSDAELQIIATNMHLSPAHGMTVNEIESDGFTVNVKISSLEEGDSPESIVKSMANVQKGLAEAFPMLKPDLVVILGDRYEALAAASAAVIFGIPVVHLHGGETTEGAFDDLFRHAITKLSTYHFASTPEYAARIISMGENPAHVFHSGAPGAEFEVSDNETIAGEFEIKTGLQPSCRFILLAMHPATLAPDGGMQDARETLKALDAFIADGYKILVTMPNSDPGNFQMRKLFEEWEEMNPSKVICVDSLGAKLFHYTLSKAALMIGNSSAALIEAPSMRLPAVNVGVRQKGRAAGPTVIHAEGKATEIIDAIRLSLSPEFNDKLKGLSLSTLNPYYRKDSKEFIAGFLLRAPFAST